MIYSIIVSKPRKFHSETVHCIYVPTFFFLFSFLKVQRCRIYTVSFPCWLRTIIEQVAQMSSALYRKYIVSVVARTIERLPYTDIKSLLRYFGLQKILVWCLFYNTYMFNIPVAGNFSCQPCTQKRQAITARLKMPRILAFKLSCPSARTAKEQLPNNTEHYLGTNNLSSFSFHEMYPLFPLLLHIG